MPNMLQTNSSISDASNNLKLSILLNAINIHLNDSTVAYHNYMDAGMDFAHACELKANNIATRKLIVEHLDILPADLRGNAMEIVSHIDTWMELWDAHKQKLNPAPTDRFAFPNTASFPKEAANKLDEALKAIDRREV